MLRVYSILYLQQVWERPNGKQLGSEEVAVTAPGDVDSSTPSNDIETVVAVGHQGWYTHSLYFFEIV